MGKRKLNFLERITGSVEVGDCWEWQKVRNEYGYGIIRWEGRNERVHRLMYEMLVGPIPDGLHIDHLCRNPPCCNPDHLEPVTPKENARRGHPGKMTGKQQREKTHCLNGHPLSGDNISLSSGYRRCRTCSRLRQRQYRKKPRGLRANG